MYHIKSKAIRCLSFICTCMLMVYLNACKTDDKVENSGSVSFSFNIPATSGRVDSEVISSLVVSIQNSEGELVYELEELELIQFSGEYLSGSIELSPGDYQLVHFLGLNEEGESLYATPVEGSDLAYLVQAPLPIDFTIQANSSIVLSPEVITIDGQDASLFGYMAFAINVVETFNITVNTLGTLGGSFIPIEANIEITAEDPFPWNYQGNSVDGLAQLKVRGGFDEYTILVVSEGYDSKTLTFSEQELNEEISFVLSPPGTTIRVQLENASLYQRGSIEFENAGNSIMISEPLLINGSTAEAQVPLSEGTWKLRTYLFTNDSLIDSGGSNITYYIQKGEGSIEFNTLPETITLNGPQNNEEVMWHSAIWQDDPILDVAVVFPVDPCELETEVKFYGSSMEMLMTILATRNIDGIPYLLESFETPTENHSFWNINDIFESATFAEDYVTSCSPEGDAWSGITVIFHEDVNAEGPALSDFYYEF